MVYRRLVMPNKRRLVVDLRQIAGFLRSGKCSLGSSKIALVISNHAIKLAGTLLLLLWLRRRGPRRRSGSVCRVVRCIRHVARLLIVLLRVLVPLIVLGLHLYRLRVFALLLVCALARNSSSTAGAAGKRATAARPHDPQGSDHHNDADANGDNHQRRRTSLLFGAADTFRFSRRCDGRGGHVELSAVFPDRALKRAADNVAYLRVCNSPRKSCLCSFYRGGKGRLMVGCESSLSEMCRANLLGLQACVFRSSCVDQIVVVVAPSCLLCCQRPRDFELAAFFLCLQFPWVTKGKIVATALNGRGEFAFCSGTFLLLYCATEFKVEGVRIEGRTTLISTRLGTDS